MFYEDRFSLRIAHKPSAYHKLKNVALRYEYNQHYNTNNFLPQNNVVIITNLPLRYDIIFDKQPVEIVFHRSFLNHRFISEYLRCKLSSLVKHLRYEISIIKNISELINT